LWGYVIIDYNLLTVNILLTFYILNAGRTKCVDGKLFRNCPEDQQQ
jgi:hypothetical protein